MDWTFPAAADEPGIFDIGRRLAEAIGRLPDATRFTYDVREMLRITRQIEAVARGGRLWVGFQTAEKLRIESSRYAGLLAAGTLITAYSTGDAPAALDGLDHRSVSSDLRRLENQWFLVSDAPEMVAFVTWELGDPASFGIGGAATPGKRFVGFVSDDPAVVGELIEALRAVPPTPPATLREPPPPPRMGTRGASLLAAVTGIQPGPSGAPDGAVVVPVGRGDADDALVLALALAKAESRSLVIVDRSGEGLLKGAYSSVGADDEFAPRRDQLFGPAIARREGRSDTAEALDAATSLGISGGAWFPTASGAEGLAEALRRFGGSLLVLPAAARRPGFVERLRGMSVERLGQLGAVVVVAG